MPNNDYVSITAAPFGWYRGNWDGDRFAGLYSIVAWALKGNGAVYPIIAGSGRGFSEPFADEDLYGDDAPCENWYDPRPFDQVLYDCTTMVGYPTQPESNHAD